MSEKGSFMLLDRDDAVLIPGKVSDPEFQEVDVTLGEGVKWEDIEDEDVAMLQSQTESALKFIRVPDMDAFFNNFSIDAEGFYPIGFGMLRYYPTLAKYEESLEE